MIKSPLRYPGGKSRATQLISSLVPDFNEYREPFVGGGSIFIYLKQLFSDKIFWINDLYVELYNFWIMAQNDVEGMVYQIYQWRTQYSVGKLLYQFLLENMEHFNSLEKSAAFFIFNRIIFSGTTLSGGYSEQAFISRFTETSVQRLKNFGKVIADTKITHSDYQKLVEQDGNNVFLFLDPPYFSATKSALYGKNGDLHKSFDHERFAQVMKKCRHYWLITYDDSPYIRDLFSYATIISWDLTYGMRNVTTRSNQTGKELFISNYLEQIPQKQQLTLFSSKIEYGI